MRRALLDYDLPPDLIATRPPAERDGARLLVLDAGGALAHAEVRDLERLALPGTLVVVNDTRVIPARLLGHKVETGGKAELLLVRRLDEASIVHDGRELPAERWTALGRASKPLRPGAHPSASIPPAMQPRALMCGPSSAPASSASTARCSPCTSSLRRAGPSRRRSTPSVTCPCRPYLHRADDPADRERYQTSSPASPARSRRPPPGCT